MVFIALVADKIHWSQVSSVKPGSVEAVIGALVFTMTGFGLGWVNCAADYSRYLPPPVIQPRAWSAGPRSRPASRRCSCSSSACCWPARRKSLNTAIAGDPIGALATLLPTWFLVPFAIVAVLGLIGGSVLDIYSSGLALLTLGVRIPRYAAALVDGVVMTAGTIYVVFFADNFVGPVRGLPDHAGSARSRPGAGSCWPTSRCGSGTTPRATLFTPAGRYGDVRWLPVLTIVVATGIGWGLVTNGAASWLTWQGYLLGPFGLGGKSGAWAFANLGVLVALALGFVVTLLFSRASVRAEESAPLPAPAAV